MQTAAKDLEGILLIDKPTGMTSHDVVDRMRRLLHIRRIGHAGTLDPSATGLLILLIGKATKVSQFLMSLDKTYEGTMKLGEVTDSHDADGEITETSEVPKSLDANVLAEHCQEFCGDQYQTPPMFSAKKIKGVPLYKLARKGKTVEREARLVRVTSFTLQSVELPHATFVVACSKGTYVRTLVHDLGQKVGCGAHLTQLRRTAIERFSIDQAHTLDQLKDMNINQLQSALIPVYQAVPSILY